MTTVLVSAFEPFDGQRINSSLETARVVCREDHPRARLVLAELPVVRDACAERLIECIEQELPDVVLMLGEAGRRLSVQPELVAINREHYRIPDNAGNRPRESPVVADGPVGYFSTLPVNAMAARMQEAGIPAEVSSSAGLYICNHLFYRVMHHLALHHVPVRAGFVHLPFLHRQATEGKGDVPGMAPETLTAAVRSAIDVSLESTDPDDVTGHGPQQVTL